MKFNSQYIHFTYKCTNAIISVLIKRLIFCVQKISELFLVEVQLSAHFTYKYTNATVGFTVFLYIVALVHKKRMWTITCLVVGLAMSPLALADL